MASIRLEYEVEYVNDSGETEQYEVTESYRIRYTEQRMYLLNYDRKVDRIFDPELDIFSDDSVDLGILTYGGGIPEKCRGKHCRFRAERTSSGVMTRLRTS